MDPPILGLDSESSHSLLEGLLSALSAASALQYSRDVYAYMETLRSEIHSESGRAPISETKFAAAPANLEANYALLMIALEQIRECLGPAFRSRNAVERLKRLIARARKHLLIVRGLLEVGQQERE